MKKKILSLNKSIITKTIRNALFLITLSLGLPNSIAMAQSAKSYTYTPEEMASFAFYKLGNIKPNFGAAFDVDPANNELWPKDRIMKKSSQIIRLDQGFAFFDPSKYLIKFKTEVVITPMTESEKLATARRYLNVRISKESDELYFPFLTGEIWVAFFPKEANMIRKIPFPEPEYDKIVRKLGLDENDDTKALLRISLKADRVDKHGPVEIDGISMWLMDGHSATIELVGSGSSKIWSYSAPWYDPRKQEFFSVFY